MKKTPEEREWDRLVQAEERFVNAVAQNIHLYDITNSAGRLYGSIFFSERPLTLDEMSEDLCMSKTSMSTGVRALSEADMIKKTWRKGVRKDLYQTDPNWYKSFTNVFIKRWSQSSSENLKALRASKEDLQHLMQQAASARVREKAAFDIQRLEDAEAYYEWMQEVIDLFESEAIFDIIPRREAPSES
ncbi:GbsR/MarR family transcriptional regulator [Alkalicoccus chagannorensis]|uniref:GbsR/MarR family transcriptional regulator n=1 Tax=Alkalicoccus chagannorensis TaxID=427072 RepID=UPI000416E76D|nr:transcriptional regulator [Alkalicoccus chagannorensis]